jgi:hypothetical protein
MAESDGNNSSIVGIVAGMVAGMVLMGAVVYFVMRPNPLKVAVTDEEFKAAERTEKQQDRALLSDLEKKMGSNHPQVQQMKMELGDGPQKVGK